MDNASNRRRRRGAILERAILEAAWEELGDQGWARFSIQRVAHRAGTGKPSIYSRWPTKATLVVACAVHNAVSHQGPRGSTGSLERDLYRFLNEYALFLASPFGDALRALASDPAAAPHALLSDDGVDPAIRPVLEAVEAARDRGELAGSDIPLRSLNLGLIMMNEHYLRRGEIPDQESTLDMVVNAWAPLLTREWDSGE